jgi:hypothetical protein
MAALGQRRSWLGTQTLAPIGLALGQAAPWH